GRLPLSVDRPADFHVRAQRRPAGDVLLPASSSACPSSVTAQHATVCPAGLRTGWRDGADGLLPRLPVGFARGRDRRGVAGCPEWPGLRRKESRGFLWPPGG